MTHPAVLIHFFVTDGLDTDWFARLTEVFPDGRSVAFHGYWSALRARHRHGLHEEVLLTPNKNPLSFLSTWVGQGISWQKETDCAYQLRVLIFLALPVFVFVDTNTNTGNDPATDTETRVALQTIFYDSLKPSRITLPIISDL